MGCSWGALGLLWITLAYTLCSYMYSPLLALALAGSILRDCTASRGTHSDTWEVFEHSYLGDVLPVRETNGTYVEAPEYELHGRAGFRPTYGDAEAANDFIGAESWDGLICAYGADLLRESNSHIAVERMPQTVRNDRFLRVFEQFFGPGEEKEMTRVHKEADRERRTVLGTLTEDIDKADAETKIMVAQLEHMESIRHGGRVDTGPKMLDVITHHMSPRALKDKVRNISISHVPGGQKKPTSWEEFESIFSQVTDSLAKNGTARWDFFADALHRSAKKLCRSCLPGPPSINVKGLGEVRWLKYSHLIVVSRFNFDHFRPCAEAFYATGHHLALREATRVGVENANRSNLQRAYALNGFAEHALGDLFAGGHIRTPRVELVQACTIKYKSNSDLNSAGFTAQQMHDEDNANGVLVTNRRGDRSWRAYGDARLFDESNRANLEKVLEAMRLSRSQVYNAYQAALDGSPIDDAQIELWTKGVFDLQPFVPDRQDPAWKPEFLLDNTCPRYRVGLDGQLEARANGDLLARSHAMLLYRAGKLGVKDLETVPLQGDCAYEKFVPPSTTTGIWAESSDCAIGRTHYKVGQALTFYKNLRYMESQNAWVAHYWEKQRFHVTCGDRKRRRTFGPDGEVLCKCKAKHLATCSHPANVSYCVATNTCSKQGETRCFPADCVDYCSCE